MKTPDLFIADRCFVGKMLIKGIYQTGKRRLIRDNTERSDELTLRREYGNKYDEFAVAVYDRYDNKIGYLEKNENEETAFYMDKGQECVAVVADIDKKSATVGIMVDVFCLTDKENMQKLKAEFEEHLKTSLFDTI
ncbi:MAG: HIRAN domain-containing protein [Clostridia bacterium]|nr:HIRAN domain-containing protein [Clostridia bacterium]